MVSEFSRFFLVLFCSETFRIHYTLANFEGRNCRDGDLFIKQCGFFNNQGLNAIKSFYAIKTQCNSSAEGHKLGMMQLMLPADSRECNLLYVCRRSHGHFTFGLNRVECSLRTWRPELKFDCLKGLFLL